MPSPFEFVFLTGFHVGCFALNIAVGIDLRKFRPWARWVDVVLATVFLLVLLAYAVHALISHKPLTWLLGITVPGLVIVALVLRTLLSPRTGVLFKNTSSSASV